MTPKEISYQARIAQLEAMVDTYRDELNNFSAFLETDKFRGAGNQFINTADVQYALAGIRSNVGDAECEAWGRHSRIELKTNAWGELFTKCHPDNGYMMGDGARRLRVWRDGKGGQA